MKTNSRFPLRLLLCCLPLALAPLAGAAPLADPAIGTGTVLGNALNPGPDRTQFNDKEWLVAKHTPTGQMYKLPYALSELTKSASGWEYSGQIEVGVIGGDADERSAQFRTYQDLDNGAYVNNFSLTLRKPDSGHTVEVTGGGAGRHDQYYGLQFGRANAWKLKLYFSETPHVFTDRYRSIWSGVGSGNLVLLPGLTPGGTASTAADNANVASVSAANPMSLSLTRKRSGARLDVDLWKSWKGYVSYSFEKRKGARPLGAVWGNNPGTAPIEVAEPIDYDTQDILAGLIHSDGLNAFNLRFSASIFDNKIDTLTFQEPYRIAPPNGVTTVPAAGAYTQGRMDLTPSNNAYNVRAEYTRSLPEFYKGALTAVVSAGTWRQDDNLIPYTTLPGVALTNVTILPGGDWSTLGSLSRRSSDASIDTRLADLTLSLNPTDKLNVKAKGRYYETDNNTNPFLAVNPNAVYVDADAAAAGNQTRGLTYGGLTGVWGRLLNDGSGASILLGNNATPAGNIPVRGDQYSSKQTEFGATGDYRLTKVSNLNLSLDRDTMRRDYRERDKTWDDRAKVGYVNRGLGNTSARVSYEYGRRRGSEYHTTTYDDSFSAGIFPVPTTAGTNVNSWIRMLGTMRNLDLADRDQHVGNVRLDTMVRSNLDAGISGQIRKSTYPGSPHGLTGDSQRTVNVDLNYQPSPRQSLYAFYSYQVGRFEQATIQSANGAIVIGAASPFGGTITPANAVEIGGTPGSGLFPLANAWSARSTDRNHVLGAGLRQEFGKVSLNVDYSYSTGRTRLAYDYIVGGAINAANAVFAGTRMPDLATDINYLDAGLRIPLTDRLSAKLVYRYQKETIRDWHYQNLDATAVVTGNVANAPTAVILDAGPNDYKVNWYGVMLQIKL